MKTLEQIRDEAAESGFYSEYLGRPQYNEISAFRDGFDTAADILMADAEKLVDALQLINKEELGSQRPGGGYSRSATLSYEAIDMFRKKYGDKK